MNLKGGNLDIIRIGITPKTKEALSGTVVRLTGS